MGNGNGKPDARFGHLAGARVHAISCPLSGHERTFPMAIQQLFIERSAS